MLEYRVIEKLNTPEGRQEGIRQSKRAQQVPREAGRCRGQSKGDRHKEKQEGPVERNKEAQQLG